MASDKGKAKPVDPNDAWERETACATKPEAVACEEGTQICGHCGRDKDNHGFLKGQA